MNIQPGQIAYSHVQPILEKRCTPCHTFGYNYTAIFPLANRGKESLAFKYVVERSPREMPPPDSQQSREITNDERQLIASWILGGAGNDSPQSSTTAVQVEKPAPVFPKNTRECWQCHGGGGHSVISVVPSLAGLPKQYLQQQLLSYRSGRRKDISLGRMNDIAKQLTNKEIENYSAYYSEMQPARRGASLQTLTEDRLRQAEIIMRLQSCNSCHNPNSGLLAPQLEGQSQGYLESQLNAYRTGRRHSPTMMEPVARSLTPAEINILSIWLSQGRPRARVDKR